TPTGSARCAGGSTSFGTRHWRPLRPKSRPATRRTKANEPHSHHRAGAQKHSRQCQSGARVRGVHVRPRALVAAHAHDRQAADADGGPGATPGRALVRVERGRLAGRCGQGAGVGTARAFRDQLGPQQQLEAGHHGELRGRSQVHRARAASDPGGPGSSQLRAAGRGSGRLHAQGRGRGLAPPAGALQGRSRGVEPIDAGRPRRTTLNSTSQGIRIPHHKENVMAIELYVFPPSPRAFKVLAVANHLGLDYELRFLDLPKGAHKTPQYAALNPNVRMPTLKDGDYALWESNAIGQYLAGKKPDAGLLPRDERARLDVTRWQFWDLAH